MAEENYPRLIEDMIWSYSRLQSFNTCPYKFFMKYISHCKSEDRFYASYGSWIHKRIENFYKGKLKKEEMVVEFLSRFSEQVKGTRPSKSIVQKYIKLGANYFSSFSPFPFNPIGVEKRVEFDIDGLKFLGFIDYLGEKDGEYYVVDNKSRDLKPRSGRKKPTKKDEELDSMLKQLYIYSTPIKREFGKYPKALCFNCFKSGVFIEEPFDINAYNKAIEWVKRTVGEIKETTDFYPIEDYFFCKYICDVSGECIYHQEAMKERRWNR